MRTIRNIIFVILFVIAIGFCLYIAPNYQKTGNEGKVNLVINYKNVTGRMKNEIFMENENIYLSINDIKNYYDKYIYYDQKYDYIIAAKNGYLACFDIKAGTVDINNNKQNAKVISKDDTYYIPMNKLDKLYNINIEYKKNTNTVVIESLDRERTTAIVSKSSTVRSKPTVLSKALEKIDAKTNICICPASNSLEDSNKEKNNTKNSILDKANSYIKNIENNEAKKWTCIKTEDGTIGYIPNSDIQDVKKDRAEDKKEEQTISLVWEYYHEQFGKAPQNSPSTKYPGINVVSPSFFYMQGSSVKENVGGAGVNYINWAKANNYQVWARIANNNSSTNDMKAFSEWINDYKKREDVINQIIGYAKQYNIDGINIDFENMYKADKNALSRFIIELKPRLESINLKLSVDVTEPDGADNWSLCYDRNTIGEIADYTVFMAYDQTSKGSKKPGSNASYDWVEKNIKKFIENQSVDPNKIILAVPFFTRVWKVNQDGTTEDSTAIIMKNQKKYIDKATQKKWLDDCKQNFIEYTEGGYTYQMWVEDSDSVKAKIDLIKKYNLAGAAFWQKGNETDDIWDTVSKYLF